jgi:putative sigma-54 modulation protein
MKINVTSRRFRAHPSLVEYATAAVEKLTKYYDGIIKSEVILEFEKARNSVKVAEINLSVHSAVMTARSGSEEFERSIDKTIGKLEVQLKKYKDRLRKKDRKTVRRVREKV